MTATGDAARGRSTPPAVHGAGVSVVVVNWNTKALLLRLLGQLRAATGLLRRPLQVIVVDNASADGSAAAADADFPEVRVLPQTQNLGFAAGVNRGLAAATQPLVLLLNTDVRFAPDSIEKLAAYADAHPDAAIVGPRILDAAGRTQASCWRTPSLRALFCHASGLARLAPRAFDPDAYPPRALRRATPVDCVSGCVLLARRALLDELRGLDERFFLYFEETDLCVRARERGHQVHFAPLADFVHDGGGSSRAVSDRAFREFQRSRVLYFRKHGGRAAGLAARGLAWMWHAVRIPPLLLLSVRRSARARLLLHARALWPRAPALGEH